MATDSATKSVHNTLSGTTADTITITGGATEVHVLNRAASGGADMYASCAFGTASPAAPTAPADNTEYIAPGGLCMFTSTGSVDVTVVVQVVGNGNDYSVIGYNPVTGL